MGGGNATETAREIARAATASGSGLTVKYLLDFEGGERALFKPLRVNFERIGGKELKDARHLEEPWGEVTASALARVDFVLIPQRVFKSSSSESRARAFARQCVIQRPRP